VCLSNQYSEGHRFANTPHHNAPIVEKDYRGRSMVFGAGWYSKLFLGRSFVAPKTTAWCGKTLYGIMKKIPVCSQNSVTGVE